jgi:hypothetical protein
MRCARRLLLPTVLFTPACVGSSPLPAPLPPPAAVALPAPLSRDVVAVVDFVDARPDFERSDAEIDERFVGGRWLALDRYFTFHAVGGDLKTDPATPPDFHARVTGTSAFAWYPFPNPGVGLPRIEPVAAGLADYLALHLEQRGLFARVLRAPDEATARAAGATLVMTGRIDRFGALFAETSDPYVVRPDDPSDWRIAGAALYSVEVRRLADGALLLAHDCVGRDEDPHLFDELARFRGPAEIEGIELSPARMPRLALADLARHCRRSLERATAPLLAAVEQRLRAEPAAQ